MGMVFVVPDVHLKPWMFEKADELVSAGAYDSVVMLGDLVDDWYQDGNLDLYNETFDAAIAFIKKHPDTWLCYGNHDVSYVWEALESGFSYYARETVLNRLEELKDVLGEEHCAFIHRIDETLFSHAGLTERFVQRHFGAEPQELDQMLKEINQMGETELWEDDSPLWARPQYTEMKMYPADLFQVVGHTPVKEALHQGNVLTLDNFSTYSSGWSIGNERFVGVDTIEKTWGYV